MTLGMLGRVILAVVKGIRVAGAERSLPLRVSVVSHLHNLLQSRRGVSYE